MPENLFHKAGEVQVSEQLLYPEHVRKQLTIPGIKPKPLGFADAVELEMNAALAEMRSDFNRYPRPIHFHQPVQLEMPVPSVCWAGLDYLTCTRDEGHSGPHEDREYRVKWEDF